MGFLVILLSISFPAQIPKQRPDCMGKAKGELPHIFISAQGIQEDFQLYL